MATSSIPAVKAALLTALSARTGLAGVQVTWGLPANPQREWVALWNAVGDQEARDLGTQARWETYDLTITISVLRTRHEWQACETRAWAIAGEVENQLRSDAQISNTLPAGYAQVAGPVGCVTRQHADECEAQVTLTVAVKNRI